MRITFDLTLNSSGRVVWVAICLGLLQIGMGSLAASPELLPGLLLALTLMLMLSFPLSLPPVLILDNFPVLEAQPAVEFTLLWFCMFVVGYLQWFLLIPWLSRPRFTTLGLSPVPKPLSETRKSTRRSSRVRKRLDHLAPAPTHYVDGLSPLERVINLK